MTWHPALSQGKPSTQIKEFAHANGRLYVRFRRGDVHSYPAPETFVQAMKAAPSVGVFFNHFVKRRVATRHPELEAKVEKKRTPASH